MRPFLLGLWHLSVGLAAAAEKGVIAKSCLTPYVQGNRTGQRDLCYFHAAKNSGNSGKPSPATKTPPALIA